MREDLAIAFQRESEKFKDYYIWLEGAMPELLFQELGQANVMLITHNLMEFGLQDYTSSILLKNTAIVICLDEPDADLQILKNYPAHSITSYQTYVSSSAPPFLPVKKKIRIVVLQFFSLNPHNASESYSEKEKAVLRSHLSKHYPEISDQTFEEAMMGISPDFLRSLPIERLAIALKMFSRATTRDQCQYEVKYNEDWEEKQLPSLEIVFAWKNTPKQNFLYRIVRTIHRHGLVVKKLSASDQNPYQTNSILVVAIDLHGTDNRPVWDVANMPDFIKDLITIKYFASFDAIDHFLVQKGVISGNVGNLLRAMTNFIHQALVHLDVHLYTLEHIEEGLCRHPELTEKLCLAFKLRFSPEHYNPDEYEKLREIILTDIEKLDTGHEENDLRRKNVLRQAVSFIQYTLKTNFYRPNYTSLSFRLDPKYLDHIPIDRTKKFPELPFAIFFIKGMHFFGFHIRFKDLARGGLRTVYPEHAERMILERNNVFTECYNLALTQQMKNKDIPEGGAKGIIFLKPYERIEAEAVIFRRELLSDKLDSQEIDKKIELFRHEQRIDNLYQAQRSFIESLITLVNCDAEGKLLVRDIIDYWKRPEYLYLGPDENMHDVMIEWIANYSKKHKYKPGSSFISGKPKVGINHKHYGVTSLGVNVYVDAVLRYLGIDPTITSFTVKMSGGPDGDVAGNEICNLYRFYPKTAKLIALTDISGTIYDPEGLDLKEMVTLFEKGHSIRFYPPQKLHEGGYLIDKMTKKQESSLIQLTSCMRKQAGKLLQEWLSGNDASFLLRHNVHHTPADIFIPGGGRPRTLNEFNFTDYLDNENKPTSRAIVEGANLYLDAKARRTLEERDVLIIKDSSANKTGVICSSFEVLCGLTLGDELFLKHKEKLVQEILQRLEQAATNEAQLLLNTHQETGDYLTDISDRISRRINLFTDQLLSYLENIDLPNDPNHPLIKCFLSYCLPTLQKHFQKQLLEEIPSPHKKAIIACHLSAQLVYRRGLNWFPSIVDILPMALSTLNT